MERAYLNTTRVIAIVICGLGVAMVATTLARGGGPLAFGVVLGVLFTLLGAGRFALSIGVLKGRGR